jgi:hypothetical protein
MGGWCAPMTCCDDCDEPFAECHAPEERLCECCAEQWAIERAAEIAATAHLPRAGMFLTHNCSRCNDGRLPCPNAGSCGEPVARND